jgi:uncharacterized membrane protein
MSVDGRRLLAVDAIRTQLWPIPCIGVVLALAAGIGLPKLEDTPRLWLPETLANYLFGGGPAEARELLSAIASSLITVTSLTFSLTVVTLQLASGQYSPRLLRTFARDRFVQITLALFLSTFVYALTLLRSVRDASATTDLFVPKFSVTLAYLLAVASVIGLVLFLAHLVREIRVETVVRTVSSDAEASVKVIYSAQDSDQSAPATASPPAHAETICATSSGFVVAVDEAAVLSAAVDADAVVAVHRPAGDYVVRGTPIASAWRAAGDFDEKTVDVLRGSVAGAVQTGDERTPVQDAGYGLRQLTDVAIKALSPGINDPTTAVHTLGHSSSLLCQLAARRLDDRVLTDDDGATRVIINRPGMTELLDLAVSQPRRYGAGDPNVLARLFTLLREVAWCTQDAEHFSAIADQLTRLRRTVAGQDFDHRELEVLTGLGDAVEEALRGDWSHGS